MLEIFIDGDACPVKDEVMRVAGRHNLLVHLVSNQWLRLPEHPRLNKVLVPQGADAADDWIAEHAGSGDIVVTADVPLAARCVASKARALAPTGKPFSESSIGMAVAVRDLMAHLRETGEATSHNPVFTKKDRSRFLDALETLIQAVKREIAAQQH